VPYAPLVPDRTTDLLFDLTEMVERLAAGQAQILEELKAIRRQRHR
jgi:hypothetical protein